MQRIQSRRAHLVNYTEASQYTKQELISHQITLSVMALFQTLRRPYILLTIEQDLQVISDRLVNIHILDLVQTILKASKQLKLRLLPRQEDRRSILLRLRIYQDFIRIQSVIKDLIRRVSFSTIRATISTAVVARSSHITDITTVR